MTAIRTAIALATETLQNAEIDTAALDARLLLEEATGKPSLRLIMESEKPLTTKEWQSYQGLIARRTQREPIAQIIGRKEFWSLDFAVSRATLTPRPDSETLIEAALTKVTNRAAPLKVLDFGTGSGCLLLAALSELPNATGIGVDISPEALQVAQLNAEALGVSGRTTWVQSDWGTAVEGAFDLIFSNPPYIMTHDITELSPEVAAFEPRQALDGGADGLDAYRALALHMKRLLTPGGWIFLEVGSGQAQDVADLMQKAGFSLSRTYQDLAGIERCVCVTH